MRIDYESCRPGEGLRGGDTRGRLLLGLVYEHVSSNSKRAVCYLKNIQLAYIPTPSFVLFYYSYLHCTIIVYKAS